MRTWTHVIVLLCLFRHLQAEEERVLQTCSWQEGESNRDHGLQPMTYDVGDGPQTFLAYVEPDVSTFYRGGGKNPPASTKVIPKHEGFAAKFINMSNQRLVLYWESHAGGPISAIKRCPPFGSGGTGTFPNHRFFFALDDPTINPKNRRHRLKEFIMQGYPENLYVYDPYVVRGDPVATEHNLQVALDENERTKYNLWTKTLLFHEQYRNVTGRSYLTNYLRNRPSHFMWPADYFGQEHWVTTRETHFERIPPMDQLEPILARGEDRIWKDSDPRVLPEYRVQNNNVKEHDGFGVMNMTLRVLSCAPRVFEIPNFLSPAEIQHILELAGGIELSRSTTGDQTVRGLPAETDQLNTRTSFNSWVPRGRSPVIDAIYRRSADLVRIDEALLRSRGEKEFPDLPTRLPLAEDLQLVHYGVGQEYAAHHDFGHTPIDSPYHPARFLTLLFYLNEGMVGGETSFPRWANAETFHSLKVKPEAGKAVLFYSQLPDGNMDDFSQHAAEPVRVGEKWLINLWIWDPIYE